MDLIHIVCLKWGTKYGPEYVNRLYAMVRRHVTKDFRFWCLTEDAQGIRPEVETVLLQSASQLDSWWNKLWLFSQDLPLPLGEQIFYIDLDTLIVDNIDEMLTDEVPDILVLRDFYHGIARTAGKIGSGLMSWQHGAYDHIWKNFIWDPQEAIEAARPHGDQWWIEHEIDAWYCWQDIWPGAVVSFKMHCEHGIPPGARIICYHGKPNIPDSATKHTMDYKWHLKPQPWVLEHWRE